MTDIEKDDFRQAVYQIVAAIPAGKVSSYGEIARLAGYPVERQRNMSAKYWIQLNFNGDIPDSEILEIVEQSYETVKAKYTKKK